MASYIDCKFSGGEYRLDGQTWINCTFSGAKILVGRGNYVLKGCHFSGCEFGFDDEAANIAALVTMLNKQETPSLFQGLQSKIENVTETQSA